MQLTLNCRVSWIKFERVWTVVKEESLKVCGQENSMSKTPLKIITPAAVCGVTWRIKNRDWENWVEGLENDQIGVLRVYTQAMVPMKGEVWWLLDIRSKWMRRSWQLFRGRSEGVNENLGFSIWVTDRIIMVLTEESRWGSRVDFGVVEGCARETMASALETLYLRC